MHPFNPNPPVSTCSQMEGMVTDLQLAKEKQQHFDEWLKVGTRPRGGVGEGCRGRQRTCAWIARWSGASQKGIWPSTVLS